MRTDLLSALYIIIDFQRM